MEVISAQNMLQKKATIIAAIGAGPHSAELIRWVSEYAILTNTPWIAVNVETKLSVDDKYRESVLRNCNLAGQLGAEVITTSDSDIVRALVRIAKENNATQIIIGKPRKRFLFGKNIAHKLIMESGNINVFLFGGEESNIKEIKSNIFTKPQSSPIRYASASLLIFFMTLVFYHVAGKVGYQTVSLLFLFTVTILPLFNFGPGPVFAAALLSALSWNFFFIPPQFTFHIAKVEDALMFFMYFLIATVSGYLTSKIRTQQMFLRQKEERTFTLYNLAKELSTANNIDDICRIAVKNIKHIFHADIAILLSDATDKLKKGMHPASTFSVDESEWHIANWVFLNGQIAGKFTNTLSSCSATFYPLKSKSVNLGVLGIRTLESKTFSIEQQNLLDTFSTQIADALERENLNLLAQKSMVASESEKLYKTLFNSISHELKTPITTIIGAVSSLNDENISGNKILLDKLLEEINIAADRLHRLVENLLDMTRLESGNLKPKLDLYPVADLINAVLKRFDKELKERLIKVAIPEDMPLVKYDFGLMEQALANIIHNSLEYSHDQSEITIEVKLIQDNCVINISDNGKGFPVEMLEKIFDKFYRVPGTKAGGTGLGLSISKGFIEAHGGSIIASNRSGGGAVFSISLPITAGA